MHFALPPHFEALREALEAEAREVLRLQSRALGDAEAASVDAASRLGGWPLLYAAEDWPRAAEGAPLDFLAQINCAAQPMPQGFPDAGLLQFFIGRDDTYGADFDEWGLGQRAVRWQMPDAGRPALSPADMAAFGGAAFPELRACALFAGQGLQHELPGAGDRAFNPFFEHPRIAALGDARWQALQDYEALNDSKGHKMGGYAFFTQDDPREDKDWLLLLQVDSDDEAGLMWGDMGVAHFFIHRDALAARDFSQVWWHWDCY